MSMSAWLTQTRRFAAPPKAVYRAHTDPKLIQKWLLGPEGWTMPVCISEARPGGKIRYEWSNGNGDEFYLTGEYLELEPDRRTVHVQRMHMPDATPDNHIETRFDPDGAKHVDDHAHDTTRLSDTSGHARHWNGTGNGSQLCTTRANDLGFTISRGSGSINNSGGLRQVAPRSFHSYSCEHEDRASGAAFE
jgi:uncharacterized protein YndB with AHSA1/START domain